MYMDGFMYLFTYCTCTYTCIAAATCTCTDYDIEQTCVATVAEAVWQRRRGPRYCEWWPACWVHASTDASRRAVHYCQPYSTGLPCNKYTRHNSCKHTTNNTKTDIIACYQLTERTRYLRLSREANNRRRRSTVPGAMPWML